MRLVGRILLVVAVASGPSVVVLIGCGNNDPRQPPLPNEVPNSPGGGVSPGSQGSSSGGTHADAGSAQSSCDCAASLVTTGPCSTCVQGTVTKQCQAQSTACTADPQCGGATGALHCLTTCDGGASCISACITSSATYQSLLACQCTLCAPSCAHAPPLSCNLDGGADG